MSTLLPFDFGFLRMLDANAQRFQGFAKNLVDLLGHLTGFRECADRRALQSLLPRNLKFRTDDPKLGKVPLRQAKPGKGG